MTTIEICTVTDGRKATITVQRDTEVEAALAAIGVIVNQYRDVVKTFLDAGVAACAGK